MMISNNYSAISARIPTPTAPTGGPPRVATTPTPTQTQPSVKMQQYIAKSKESTGSVTALTGKQMIADLSSRAETLGVEKIQSNAIGLGSWLKDSSMAIVAKIPKVGDPNKKDDAAAKDGTTIIGAAASLGSGAGQVNSLISNGVEKTMKMDDASQKVIAEQSNALNGNPTVAPKSLTDQQATIGFAAPVVSVISGLADTGLGALGVKEGFALTKSGQEKEDLAFEAQGLHTQVGNIANGKTAGIQDSEGGVDPIKVDSLANQVKVILPSVNLDGLKTALTNQATGKATAEDTQLLGQVGNQLHRTSLTLLDEGNSLKAQGSLKKQEEGLNLAKGLSNLTGSTAQLASHGMNVHSAAVEVSTQMAQAAAVTGVTACVSATIEMAVNIHSAVKASGVEKAMKCLRNPTEASLKDACQSLNTKATKLEAEASKLKDGPKKTALLAQATELRATATKLSVVKPEDLKLTNTKLDASAKQIEKRQGFWSKVGKAVLSALKVGAAIASTVAVFAGAVCLAATPVGWALAGAALVGGIALGCYKAHQAYGRYKENKQLEGLQTNTQAKLGKETEKLPEYQNKVKESSAKIENLTQELSQLSEKLKTAKPDTPEHKGLEEQIQKHQGLLQDAQSHHVELQKPLENIVQLKVLNKDISIMRCRKDPNFAANKILKQITSDPKADGLSGDKAASRQIKKLEAESIVEALGMNPDQLRKMMEPEKIPADKVFKNPEEKTKLVEANQIKAFNTAKSKLIAFLKAD